MKNFIIKCVCLFVFISNQAQVGALDTTFGVNGNAITYFGNSMSPNYFIPQYSVMLSDGKIMGMFSGDSHVFLKRFNTNGSLDTTFGTNGGIDTYMPSVISSAVQIVLQTDGKLVVGGNKLNGTTGCYLIRYNSDGTLDTTFGTNGLAVLPIIYLSNFTILPNNTFVLGFGADNSGLFKIAKVTTNGSLDTSFGTNGIVATSIQNNPNEVDYANLFSVQPDGKIIVTGRTTGSDAFVHFCSVRYLPNGMLDTSFGTNGISVYYQYASTVSEAGLGIQILQSDGKFIVSAYVVNNLNQFSGTLLLRFNPNGSSDSTFGTNGSVLIDNPTISGSLPSAGIMLMQPDNKIIVAGGYNNEYYHYFIGRLNTDGTYDTSFNNTGFNTFGLVIQAQNQRPSYYSLYLQSDGKILAVGIGEVNGGNSFALFSRFNSGLLETEGFAKGEFTVSPNPVQNVLSVSNENAMQYELFTILGATIQAGSLAIHGQLDCSNLAKGMYLLKLNGDNGESKVVKLVKE